MKSHFAHEIAMLSSAVVASPALHLSSARANPLRVHPRSQHPTQASSAPYPFLCYVRTSDFAVEPYTDFPTLSVTLMSWIQLGSEALQRVLFSYATPGQASVFVL